MDCRSKEARIQYLEHAAELEQCWHFEGPHWLHWLAPESQLHADPRLWHVPESVQNLQFSPVPQLTSAHVVVAASQRHPRCAEHAALPPQLPH